MNFSICFASKPSPHSRCAHSRAACFVSAWTAFVAALFMNVVVAAPQAKGDTVNGLIVKFETSAVSKRPELADAAQRTATLSRAMAASAAGSVNLRYARPLASSAELYQFDAPMALAAAQDAASRIALMPGVAYATINRKMQTQAVPADPDYGQQWGFQLSANVEGANFEAAWDVTRGNASQTLGIVDSGIAKAHPELTNQLRRSAAFPNGGYDFYQLAAVTPPVVRDNDPEQSVSSCGHGSHVAGTIAAETSFASGVAAVGVAGGAPDARVQMARALDFNGEEADVIDAMLWLGGYSVNGVADNPTPVSVINMSLGGGGACGPAYVDAVSRLAARGITVVAAAGNDGVDASSFAPANCRGVIAVAASQQNGSLAGFSNRGQKVTLTAPGVSIYSTGGTNGGNCYKSGTSMAAPHVTAAIGLAQSVASNLSPAQMALALRASARPFPASSNCQTLECGAGLLDARRLVDRVAGNAPTTVGWSAGSETVRENDGELVFTLSRVGNASSAVNVNVIAINGSATQGVDYGAAVPAAVSWASGDTADKQVRVPIIARSGEQGARAFSVSLSTSSPGVQLISPTSANVTISEVDCNVVTDIAIGDVVNGNLGQPGGTYCRGGVRGATYNTVRYRFTATAGTRVTINLRSTTAAPAILDPYVYLLDSNFRILAENDDIESGRKRDSYIEQFELPASGTYYIDATSWGATQDATGTYQLSLYNCGPYRAASACNLDVDNDGFFDAADAYLAVRSIMGFIDPELTSAARFRACATRKDASAINAFVQQQLSFNATLNGKPFDIDGDGDVRATTDGLLLLRVALGVPLATAAQGAVNPLGTRSSAAAVASYLQSACTFTATP